MRVIDGDRSFEAVADRRNRPGEVRIAAYERKCADLFFKRYVKQHLRCDVDVGKKMKAMSGLGQHIEYAQNYIAQIEAQQARDVRTRGHPRYPCSLKFWGQSPVFPCCLIFTVEFASLAGLW